MPAGKISVVTHRVKTSRRGESVGRNEVKRMVKRAINYGKEKKHYDLNFEDIDVIDTGNTALLTGVTNEDSDTTRIGDRITMQSLEYKFRVVPQATASKMRLVLLQWKQDSSNAPTLSTLFEQGGTYTLGFDNWDEMKSNAHQILFDRTYNLAGSASNGARYITGRVKLFGKKIPKKQIQFDNSASSGWDHIYAIVFSDKATSGGPLLDYSSRLIYTDA